MPASTALLDIADELYAEPLAAFTAARDARARALRADGEVDLAAAVKALRKPSTAAWVANLLVRREAGQVDQVLAVGAALREAQAAMEAGELRALTRQRRQLTTALAQQARSLAADEGLRVTEAVAAQVEGTLTAAMVDADCGRALRSGLLVAPLSTTGVAPMEPAALAGALAAPDALGFAAAPREAPVPPRADLHVVPDPDAAAKAISAAEARLAEAEEAHREAAEALAGAEAERSRLAARSLQLQAELEELRRRAAELEAESDEVDEEAAEVAEERDEAAAALRRADADRASAREALERVRLRFG
ncbi:hypothetical protein E8D34_03070 [Nocardioides sp. GY 10113]|uniref:hypothetical protein n=1 Tax=Nocardioides sp. GY 10113 TaxID=2569761 RepID=UPI0010A83028|nr:hypothetical protein [Nocardioides sp. GY 10113]TIC88671.1 hypothetical protein E8D34_03070 [Nocardioides sp. GY 10113]